MDREKVLERDKKRYEALMWIFEKAEGTETVMVDLSSLLEENNRFSESELVAISDYLAGQGLIKQIDDGGLALQLTHRGILEVEESIKNPEKATENFPAQVIQYFNAPVGSVQTGNQNIANVQQNLGAKTEDVINLLRELKEHISENNKQEGMEYIEGLEAEVKSEKPSESRIKLFLKGLGGVVKDTGKELLIEVGKKAIAGEIQFPS